MEKGVCSISAYLGHALSLRALGRMKGYNEQEDREEGVASTASFRVACA